MGLYKNRLQDSVFNTVAAFCLENQIPFHLERFSDGIEEDREYVLRLPACHVYYKDDYQTTFYLEDSVQKVLLDCIAGFSKTTFWWPSFNLRVFGKRKRINVVGSIPGFEPPGP